MHRHVAMAAAVAMVVSPVAKAQTIVEGHPPEAAIAQAHNQQRSFDIPAQPLSSALNAFGNQAGMQVSIEASVVRGLQSQPVVGTMTPAAALSQMLAGTGIVTRFMPGGGVILSRPDIGGAMQLDPVQVQANVAPPTATIGNLPPPAPGGQVATGGMVGVLGTRSYLDLPYSVTSFTSTLIESQQAMTIGDVVANDPGATKVAGQFYDTLRIRGFQVSSREISVDGLFGMAARDRTILDGYDRVEVFKGPSAFLNGFVGAGIGGYVNLVPKWATKDPVTHVELNYVTAGQLGAQADIGRRFGENGEFGVRFNGLYRDGYISLQNARERVGDARLALDYRGTGVRATANFGYTKQDLGAFNQIFRLAPNATVPVSPNVFQAVQQPWETANSEFFVGMGRMEADLGNHFTAYAAYGQSYSREIWLRTLATNLISTGTFTQSASQLSQSVWNQAGEAGVRGNFDTGFINHKMVIATTGFWQILGFESGNIPFTLTQNLYNPSFNATPQFAAITSNPAKFSSSTQTSFALTDTLSVADERVQLILGGRSQSIENINYAPTGVAAQTYFANAFTPTVGLVVRPWSNVSLYGNYIQSLQQGPIAPNTALNAGQMFAPLVSQQIEVGAKVDFGKWSATLGLFDITQPSGILNATTNIFSVNGRQRNQGIDFNTFGEPWAGFRMLGGFMLLNAKYEQTANGAFDGNKVSGVPDFTLKLGAEYDLAFAKGLTLTGLVNFFSNQYANELNTQVLSSYAVFNVGARYTFEVDKRPLVIRANIDNLFNESAWATATTAGQIYRGVPRTFFLTLAANF